jgi:hypothetical protein
MLSKEDGLTFSEFHGLITRSAKKCCRTLTRLLFTSNLYAWPRVLCAELENVKKSVGFILVSPKSTLYVKIRSECSRRSSKLSISNLASRLE